MLSAHRARQLPDFLAGGEDGTAGPGHDTRLDITRIREDTGYEPAYGVARGMPDLVAWLATHER